MCHRNLVQFSKDWHTDFHIYIMYLSKYIVLYLVVLGWSSSVPSGWQCCGSRYKACGCLKRPKDGFSPNIQDMLWCLPQKDLELFRFWVVSGKKCCCYNSNTFNAELQAAVSVSRGSPIFKELFFSISYFLCQATISVMVHVWKRRRLWMMKTVRMMGVCHRMVCRHQKVQVKCIQGALSSL